MQEDDAIRMFEGVFESSTVSGAARPLVVQYHLQIDPFLVPGATRYQMLMTMTSKPGGRLMLCHWLHCMGLVPASQHAAEGSTCISSCTRVHETAQWCFLQPGLSWDTDAAPAKTGTMQRPAVSWTDIRAVCAAPACHMLLVPGLIIFRPEEVQASCNS